MGFFSLMQLALFLVTVLLLVKPLGGYMARVFAGERTSLDRWLCPVERAVHRWAE